MNLKDSILELSSDKFFAKNKLLRLLQHYLGIRHLGQNCKSLPDFSRKLFQYFSKLILANLGKIAKIKGNLASKFRNEKNV